MALTDDFALYALGVAAQESHPLRADSRCLNRVQFKMTCDCCTEACPAGITIHEGRIDWGACTNCNLCVTACPTGAMSESASLMRTMASACRNTAAADAAGSAAPAAVTVACTRHSGPADVRLSCVASLSWEYAAIMALRGTLVIKTSACRECPETDCRDRVRGLISQLRRFFGPDEFARRIMPKAPVRTAEAPGAAVEAAARFARKQAGSARRAALESATGMAKSAAARLSEQGESANGQQPANRREALLDAIAAAPADVRMPLHWQSLTVDGDCRGCTVCERICPNHAIRIQLAGANAGCGAGAETPGATAGGTEPANEPVNEPVNAFIHDASRCTQCGLCYMSCPEQAISDWEDFACGEVPAIRTTPIDVAFCEKCGKPFKPKAGATRCPACSRFRFA